MKKGFTIIETLVALTILIVGVTGAFTAASQAISNSTFAKDQVIAFYLAEEGVEMIKNVRDTNALQGNQWLHGVSENPNDPCFFSQNSSDPGKSCYKDVTMDAFLTCSDVGACPVLNQNSVSGMYYYHDINTTLTPTPFTREIHLARVSNTEVAVTVTITWQKGVVSRQFRARENIYDWHPI